ncbi:hypothetical protein C9374_002188 [Naegleria lovaniensis]|uniref:Uncharacterized protein n=1 Tax=Naegleria lovaniensis TaxID=51637 RepID=A0AA88GUL2_NAELO|nr:uncharacterized protein C9374_002188 [Naegleria lovaniensis]KAG2386444.1 hypothetical protein C9374_002188 [Naegleria lovaniensis]
MFDLLLVSKQYMMTNGLIDHFQKEIVRSIQTLNCFELFERVALMDHEQDLNLKPIFEKMMNTMASSFASVLESNRQAMFAMSPECLMVLLKELSRNDISNTTLPTTTAATFNFDEYGKQYHQSAFNNASFADSNIFGTHKHSSRKSSSSSNVVNSKRRVQCSAEKFLRFLMLWLAHDMAQRSEIFKELITLESQLQYSGY